MIDGLVVYGVPVDPSELTDEEKEGFSDLKGHLLLKNVEIPSLKRSNLLMAVKSDSVSAYELGKRGETLQLF